MRAKKEKRPGWLVHPYDNSEGSHRLFDYDRLPRQALSLSSLDYAKVGMLLETYVDALHLSLVMDEPALVRKLRDRPQEIRDPAFFTNNRFQPPRFIREAMGDYRAATSFFRADMAMQGQGPWVQDKQPETVGFAQVVHAQLRKVATDYGKAFTIQFFPPAGEGGEVPPAMWRHFRVAEKTLSHFRALQKEYADLQRKTAEEYRQRQAMVTEETEKESARITKARERKYIFSAFMNSDGFAHLRGEIQNVMDELIHALSPAQDGSGMNQFYLQYGEHYLPLSNAARLDSRFSLSYPALMMVSLGSKGRHDIDEMVASKEIFKLFSQVIGVESQITQNLQHFHDEYVVKGLKKKGVILNDDLLYGNGQQQALLAAIRSHTRGIQLLYAFHQTAGQIQKIYPQGKNLALDDMESLLHLAGAGTQLAELRSPQEVACLLYALERRVSLGGKTTREQMLAMEKLAGFANEIGKYSSFAKIPLADRQRLEGMIQRMKDTDDDLFTHVEEVEPAIALLEGALPHMAASETRQRAQQMGRGRG